LDTFTRTRLAALALVVSAVVASCSSGSSSSGGVKAAQARVTSSEKAVADAQTAVKTAETAFCNDTKSYIATIDRYGKVFDQSAATVGDLKSAGADLAAPKQDAISSAQAVGDSRDALAKAQQDLAAAKADLAAKQAAATGASTTTSSSTASTTTTTLVPTATVDRVKKAESDFTAATKSVTDQTPVLSATAELNSAALALEMAWLRAFSDAGCFTDEQQKQAEAAVHDYTVSLQTALQTTGFYSGPIDGIYGPSTADAVKKLQTANGLKATGFVDQATALALSSAMAAKGGAVATRSLAHTAAVQTTLKLAGYWTGAIDGRWTPELTDALKKFQTSLGIPATGTVDAATIAALERALANAKTPPATPTPTTVVRSTTTTSSP
jgi:peptidoglycan hydrolase-like protein with peptidoglycan-binding domain